MSSTISSTSYDKSSQTWTLQIESPSGRKTVVCKHLVMATGIGSQKPSIPKIKDQHVYEGHIVHSAVFRSGKALKEQGRNVS